MSAPGPRHICSETQSPSSTGVYINPRTEAASSSVGDIGNEYWVFGHGAMLNPREFTFRLGNHLVVLPVNSPNALPLGQVDLQAHLTYPEPRDVQAGWTPLATANPFGPPRHDFSIFTQDVSTNIVKDTKEFAIGGATGRGASHARAESFDSTATDNLIFESLDEDTDTRKANVGAAIGQSARHAQSTDSNEPDTAIFWAPGQRSSNNPSGEEEFNVGTPGSVALPHVQVLSTPQSPSIAVTLPRGADQRTQTPPSRPHKRVKLGWEKVFNEGETDFILYLSLQNMQAQAVGVELNRMTQQYTSSRLDIDDIARVMGREVVSRLRNFQESKGTEEEAERIVSELLTRGASRGWSAGPLSRAKAYCKSLTRGKVLSEDRRNRRNEARCRTALAKWRIDRAGVMPRQDGRTAFERMAYQGMVMKAAQKVADPNKESMKRNLLELWEHGTIGGKAIE